MKEQLLLRIYNIYNLWLSINGKLDKDLCLVFTLEFKRPKLGATTLYNAECTVQVVSVRSKTKMRFRKQ